MSVSPGTAENVAGDRVAIHVVDDNGSRRQYTLKEGASVMLGSSANCGIQLTDPKIDSIHCLLRLMDGELSVQDWCSSSGTFVDDVRVEEEAPVALAATVRINRFTLRFAAAGGETCQQTTVPADPMPAAADHQAPETADQSESRIKRPAAQEGAVDSALTLPKGQSELQSSEAVQPESPKPVPDAATEDTSDAAQTPSRSSRAAPAARPGPSQPTKPQIAALPDADVDPELVELLRAEVECLQNELVQRDQQLAEWMEQSTPPGASDESVGASETEALVGRLEDLLQELEASDQRVRALEELLLAEQEVVQTQNEEKHQIEAWLGDIEQRLTAREAEWKAERDVLAQRVERLKAERDDADLRIQSAVEQGGEQPEVTEAAVQAVRSELDEIREQLAASEQQRARLEQALEETREGDSHSATQAAIENAVREERLAISQERAALSRERSELTRMRSQLETLQQHAPRQPSEADERFATLRQTLKEIHAQEKGQQTSGNKPGLGQRLADLWKRLDGPTDTD